MCSGEKFRKSFAECRNYVSCPLCVAQFRGNICIARTGAYCSFLRFSNRPDFTKSLCTSRRQKLKGTWHIGIRIIQYLWVRPLFKQLTLRSTFCKIRPVRKSKKPTRALSVSMQIFPRNCATLSGDERSRFRHLRNRRSNISSQPRKICVLKCLHFSTTTQGNQQSIAHPHNSRNESLP